MALGRTLLELEQALRAESRRSTLPAHTLNDRDLVRGVIARAYSELYDLYDWQHLMVEVTQAMNAGQRYYDFPATIEPLRTMEIHLRWGGEWQPEPLPRGIDISDYTQFDSEADVRADPVERWDYYNDGTNVQYEVHPIPASNTACLLKLRGMKKRARLTQDADRCDLDDTPIILWSIALLSPLKQQQAAFERARAAVNVQRRRIQNSEPSSLGGPVPSSAPMSRTDRRFAYVRR